MKYLALDRSAISTFQISHCAWPPLDMISTQGLGSRRIASVSDALRASRARTEKPLLEATQTEAFLLSRQLARLLILHLGPSVLAIMLTLLAMYMTVH